MSALSKLPRRALVAAAVLVAVGALLGARGWLFASAPLGRLTATPGPGGATTVWQGSVRLPRGGPYLLGFESPGGRATLAVDGRQVAAGTGQVSSRVVYEAKIASLRFEAPGGARLLWHPPGRRGPLEYLPASALSPEPPERARFGAGAGASRADGVIAGVIAALLIFLAVYLARPLFSTGTPAPRASARWALAVGVLALAVRWYDLGAAGQTWDEDVNWSAGRNYVTNWLELDFATSSWQWNMEHPPVMKYAAGIGAQLADGYGPARAISGLMVALACMLLVPIGRRLSSLPVGVIAGAVAALSPHLIAHGKIVGHEAPTALFWALGVWLALMAHDAPAAPVPGEPPESWLRDTLFWRLVVIGAVLGLAVFSRFVNALLAPLLGAILLLQAPPGRRARTVAMGLAVLAPVALAVGFAVWPRLWSEPLAHLQEAWAKLRKPHSAEPFLGRITNQPPRYYFAVYLVATAPLGVVLACLAWLGRVIARARSEARQGLIALAWVATPMLVLFSPVRQDGVRYVIPSLLALAVIAALGLEFAVEILARRWQRLDRARALAVAGALLCGYLAVTDARAHPYYLDYYGEHVGGPAGVAAHERFEIAWWGEGIGDAVAYVNQHAAPGARVHKECVEPGHLTWLRADLWPRLVRQADKAEWIVVYQPSWRRCPVPADARLVHRVSVMGAPLVDVYQRAP